MTREEILKEQNRLAKNIIYKHDLSKKEAFHEGFNAALELMERERVKPLRNALKHYADRDGIEELEVNPEATIYEYVDLSDFAETAKEALAKVEEWK